MASDNRLAPIPKPPGRPVVGNMLSIDREAPLQHLMELARQYGPIFWLDMMGTPLVVASGHDIVNELCDESRFDKAVRGSLRRVRAIGGDGLFTGDTQEPNWAKAHNILLPTFSQRAMQSYLPMMVDIADQLMLKWERLNADDEIDVVRDMTALALDTIGVCGFNYRFNSFYRRDFHPYIDAMTRTLEMAMTQRGLPYERFTLAGRLKQLKEDVAYMNSMVDAIIKERRRSSQDRDANDLLNYMLTGVDKSTGEPLDDVNIRYQINTFLIAGHETTSGLLSFTLYLLLHHPDVLRKAYAEADRVLGRDISLKPTFAQVNQLTYISQILKEALRLYPTAPAIGLYPYKDETVAGQYPLKARTFITVLSLMLHRDRSVWGDKAEDFNPDHFSREAEAARPPNAYKPFGNGQRACIGRQFAMQEAAMVIGMILQRFELFDHKRYQLKIKESLTIKPDGFAIKVKMRSGVVRGDGAQRIVATRETAEQAKPRRRASHGTPLAVFYGSNLGAAEDLARRVAEAGDINGFQTTLAPLDDAVDQLPTKGAVAIVTASYNGAAPDNAAQFVQWLQRRQAPDMLKNVNYVVFGCGNSDWASTYQTIPRLIDAKMQELGATRLTARAEGDAREDLDGQFERWLDPLWPTLAKELSINVDFSQAEHAKPLYSVETLSARADHPIHAASGATPLRLIINRELQSAGSPRSTRHIEFELPSGVSYRPGDHLSVIGRNSDALCGRVETRFGFAPDAAIKLTAAPGRRSALPVDEAIQIRRLLRDHLELQSVATRKQIQVMAEHTRCPHTKPKLAALAREDADGPYRRDVWMKRLSVIDLLEEHPACELPFAIYLEMTPLLTPRYYSISSSPSVAPDQCAITVAVVKGPAKSGRGEYAGLCSTHLASLKPGEVAHAAIRPTKAGFKLPDDPSRPIIMIGPGTGLAPFRGFLQERAARQAAGDAIGEALLFFGCRRRDEDFIYEAELTDFATRGLVGLHVAFSRGDGGKQYVQDMIAKESDPVWRLIEQDAIIYVCGDGAKMEPDVKRTLIALHGSKTGAPAAESAAWMEQLGRDNRYVLDVWAGN